MKSATVYRTPKGVDDILVISDGEWLEGIVFVGSVGAGKFLARLKRAGEGLKVAGFVPSVHRDVSRWLDEYFSGKAPAGTPQWRTPGRTPFQMAVQSEMLAIPRGETRTYGQIAENIATACGKAKMSAQAVGQAVGVNPLCLIIPCHRVIAAGGKLGGYSGGLENKAALLRLEGVNLPR